MRTTEFCLQSIKAKGIEIRFSKAESWMNTLWSSEVARKVFFILELSHLFGRQRVVGSLKLLATSLKERCGKIKLINSVIFHRNLFFFVVKLFAAIAREI